MPDLLYSIPVLLVSVVVHEVAHGWVALLLGDTTARDQGRLTLNPVPHIDLFGSILVPLFSYLAAGRVFIAWAKPVPVNPGNFGNARRDNVLVAIAGPIANLLLAGLCAVGAGAIATQSPGPTEELLLRICMVVSI